MVEMRCMWRCVEGVIAGWRRRMCSLRHVVTASCMRSVSRAVCRVQSKRHSGFSVVCLLSRWTWTSDPVMVAAALGGGASPKQMTGLGLGGVPASE
jgi:hypothetical protein